VLRAMQNTAEHISMLLAGILQPPRQRQLLCKHRKEDFAGSGQHLPFPCSTSTLEILMSWLALRRHFTFSPAVLETFSFGTGSKEKLSEKGLLGSFLLGVIFALTFCPFSAVLFFGMLIPLSLKTGDGLILPSVFAFATGLPVIIFSFIMVYSISKLGLIMDKVQTFEKWSRKIASVVFICVGIYYLITVNIT
jgi:cytochrome c biogenesis protein CcdA